MGALIANLRPSAWLAVGGLVVLLALTFKPVVENDGIGYFAYLHSVAVDHDLNLANEYQAARDEGISYYPPLLETRTSTGLLADFFPTGAAIVAAPAYLLALAIRPSGEPQYGPPFSTIISLVSLFLGLLALVLSFRLASAFSSRGAALAGVAGTALATPFLYYLLYEPSYSHTFSACAVAGFLYLWLRGRGERTAAGWVALGLVGGLMGEIRFQDAPLLLIGLLDRPRRWWHLALFLGAALLALVPQLITDQVLFGQWLPERRAGQDLQFIPGHYWQLLLSSHHGLFSWSPIALVAVAGFWFVPDRRLQLAFACALGAEVLIGGAAPDWDGGFSFGMRRLLSLTPFFAIGIAAISGRVGACLRWGTVAVLAAWNLALMANFTYVMNGSVDPGFAGLLAGQLKGLRYLPHLVTQGAAGRALLLWPFLHLRFLPLEGLALVAGEALCLGAALLTLSRLPELRRTESQAPRRTAASPRRGRPPTRPPGS